MFDRGSSRGLMKRQDKKNLVKGLPFYLLMLLLIVGIVVLSRQRAFREGRGNAAPAYHSIDEVINRRQTWEPVLADWQGKEVPDLVFLLPDGQTRHLADYRGRECVVIVGATWFPPFRLQLAQAVRAAEEMKEGAPAVAALTAESAERIEEFLKRADFAGKSNFELGSVTLLAEPFSLPDGFPCLFFIDAQGRLKLAAVGLIPFAQLKALIELPLPE